MKTLHLVLPFLLTISAVPVLAAKREIVSIPLPKADTLRFIVAGDAGSGDPHLHNGIMALTKKMRIDGILLVGDNIYPCGVKSVDDPQWAKVTVNFADAGVPIYPILGNHDYGDPTVKSGKTVTCGEPSPAAELQATGVVPHWTFPARNYALRSPLADIIMIDTQPIASEFARPYRGSETMKSEMGWIAGAFEQSGRGWKIAAGHHTIYSSGEHGFMNHHDQRHLRAHLLPLLQTAEVDLYICGHDHDAELIGDLQRGHSRPVFLIAGNGAHSATMQHRTRADEPPTVFPPAFPPDPLIGFALLEITAARISITFYDGAGIVRSPTYTIDKR